MHRREDNQPVKMNIVFLGNFLYPEGMAATKRKQQFIDYFKQNGAEVKILVLYQGSNKNRPIEECEGNHQGTYYRIIGNRMSKGLNVLYEFPFLIFLACKLLTTWRIKGRRNVILSFGFDIFDIIPFLWAKILGYKIYFDLVEDFWLYEISTRKEKIYFKSARIIHKLFLNTILSGISTITKHLEAKYRNDFRGPVTFGSHFGICYKK